MGREICALFHIINTCCYYRVRMESLGIKQKLIKLSLRIFKGVTMLLYIKVKVTVSFFTTALQNLEQSHESYSSTPLICNVNVFENCFFVIYRLVACNFNEAFFNFLDFEDFM